MFFLNEVKYCLTVTFNFFKGLVIAYHSVVISRRSGTADDVAALVKKK